MLEIARHRSGQVTCEARCTEPLGQGKIQTQKHTMCDKSSLGASWREGHDVHAGSWRGDRVEHGVGADVGYKNACC